MQKNTIKPALVTVIVPVHNVEKYVEKCINSILNQSYKKLEIILIDDGSTDKSPEILDKIAKTDNRIIVIHKKNVGVSSARNYGLKIARGEYICFVDSDDFLEKDYIEYFYSLLDGKNIDVAVGYSNFDYRNTMPSSKENKRLVPANEAIKDIYTGKLNVAVWNKFYRHSFLKKHEIMFDPKIWYGEGMLFNIVCLTNTSKVTATDKRLYHQTYNPNSAMRNFNLKSNLCGIQSMFLQKELIKNSKDKEIQRAWEFHLRCYNMSILKGIIKTNSKRKYKKEYKTCVRGLRGNIMVVLNAPVATKTKLTFLAAALFPVRAASILVKKEQKQSRNSIN